jgi:glutathione S-transferase
MRSRNHKAAGQSAEHPVVFGAPYSVYVRVVRLALEEKGVRYELVPIDIFAPGGAPPEHKLRHPFGKIPAFEHAGFSLYEAGAIARYVDEVFPGPSLQPDDARARARMNQIISILDSYAYRTLVWDIYVERVSRPASRASSDERRISAALPKAEVCLSALSELMDGSAWLTGSAISLADLHAAPMFAVFRLAPEGSCLLAEHDELMKWWDRVSSRQSFS